MPPSLTSVFSTLRYSPLLAASPLRTLFTSAPPPTHPSVQRYLLRNPFSGAARECPTPVILVRAIGLSNAYPSLKSASEGDNESWEDWGGMFAEKGYTALEVDIAAPKEVSSPTGPDTSSPLKAMSSLLASQIRLLAIPFPPILISSGQSCLLTQMYIEDNPASGLVLIDPPGDTVPAARKGEPALPTFGYEPAFPILLMASNGRKEEIEASRLGVAAKKGRGRGGKGVTLEEAVDGDRGEKSRIVVERWMDSCGF